MEGVEKVDLVVVGAGWAGLAAAKTYIELHPFSSVVVFDSADSVGGVWAAHRIYPGLKSNNMRGTYEYPDFPMDEKTFGVKPGEHIPGQVLHDYLTQFAKKFGVYERIRFNTKVETAEKIGQEGWLLQLTTSGGPAKIVAEKLIVATGQNSEPFMPIIPGVESFAAPVFHVKDFREHSDLIKTSSEIVVLGGTKSAWDVAYAFATAGVQVNMVIRESGHGPIWMAPPYVTPLKRWLEKLVTTRFLTWLSPCIWGAADGYAGVRNFLHGTVFGRTLVNAFWSILGNDVLTLNAYDKHPETAKLKPWSNVMFVGSGTGILNYETDFFDLVRNGMIKVHVADISSLSGRTVNLSNGEKLSTSALICSTGWKHHPPITFLPAGSSTDASLGLPYYSASPHEADPLITRADQEILSKFPRLKDQPVINLKFTEPPTSPSEPYDPTKLNRPYRLYRFMVPPSHLAEKDIAFIGVPMNFNTSTVATVQALWISLYFDGRIQLPDADEAEYETALHSRFGRWRYSAGHGAQYPDFVFDALPYMDLLCGQMGLKVHRKGGVLKEIFSPYGVEDHRNLVDEWRETYEMKEANGMNGASGAKGVNGVIRTKKLN